MDDIDALPTDFIPPPPPAPVAAPSDDDEVAFQDPREAELKRIARMPQIDHLHDATVRSEDGQLVFVPDPGERVVLERRTTLLRGNPWLDTRLLKVVSVDEVTGMVRLYDEDLKQTCYSNYINAGHHRMKLPPAKGRWDSPPPVTAPKPTQEASSSDPKVDQPSGQESPQVGPDGQPIKRGRGRPKGTKNRSREVIQAEKAQKAEERKAKKAARMAKRK